MKTPTERAAEAIAIEPDPTDRDAIAWAHSRVAIEASLTRDAVRNLASGPLTTDALDLLAGAVSRLRALRDRRRQLDVMAKAALQAQVDADPDMAGSIVMADGTIRQRQAVAADIMAAIDQGEQDRARELLDAALGKPESFIGRQGPECPECETRGENCLAHRGPRFEDTPRG